MSVDLALVREQMLDLLAQKSNMQAVVNKGSEILENPILVIDPNFRILMGSTGIDVDDDNWTSTMMNRFVNEEVIASMQESMVIQELQSSGSGGGTVESDIPNGHKCIRVALFTNRRYIGFVGVYDYNHPFSENDKSAIKIIAKAVNAMMNYDPFYSTRKGSMYELFLKDLLEADGDKARKDVMRRYSGLSFGNLKTITVIAQKDTTDDSSNMPASFIKSQLEQIFYSHVSIIYENRIVALINMDKKLGSITKVINTSFNEFCEKNGLIAGRSRIFEETENAYIYYQHAMTALRYGIRTESQAASQNHIYVYDDHMIDHILNVCKKSGELETFVHKDILKLIRFDKEYKSAYYDSLRTYLYNFGNMSETSIELGVHYNTIKYRIKMIQDIIGRTLEDPEYKLQLFFSCRMMDKFGNDKVGAHVKKK